MKLKNIVWTSKEIQKKLSQFENRSDLRKREGYFYKFLYKNHKDILDKVFPLNRLNINNDNALALLKKYKSRQELRKKNDYLYHAFMKNRYYKKYLDIVFPKTKINNWTIKTAIKLVENCSSYSDYRTKYPNAYSWLNSNKKLYILREKFPKTINEYDIKKFLSQVV